jgi:hypothetical protein
MKDMLVPPATVTIPWLSTMLTTNVSDCITDNDTDCVWEWTIEILRDMMTVIVLPAGIAVDGGMNIAVHESVNDWDTLNDRDTSNDRDTVNDGETVNDWDTVNDSDAVKLAVGVTVSRTIVGKVRPPGTE